MLHSNLTKTLLLKNYNQKYFILANFFKTKNKVNEQLANRKKDKEKNEENFKCKCCASAVVKGENK